MIFLNKDVNEQYCVHNDKKDVGFELMTVAHMVHLWHEKQLAGQFEAEFTSKMLRVLYYIKSHNAGDVYQKHLEDAFKVRPATISANLNLMEKNGLITRHSVKTDGRLKKIELTEKGRNICDKCEVVHLRANKVFESVMSSEEKETLSFLLAKVKKQFELEENEEWEN